MSEAELQTNQTTIEEIKKIKEAFRQNELYQQSLSLCKDYQLEQFSADGKILEGKHSRIETINGKEMLVIYTFKNGMIHSENDLPAIEYPMHWEYWDNGLLIKVCDEEKDVREYWENGVPYKIVNDYSKRKEYKIHS